MITRILGILGLLSSTTLAEVAINEIFYHAPNELDQLEFVELTNTGDTPIRLAGWKLAGEIDYEFPVDTVLDPHGYVVVAKNGEILKEFFDVEALGEFKKSLSNRGGELKLVDAEDQVVESVEYRDRAPWPVAADGYSASMERVCPTGPAGVASNWAPSELSDDYASWPSGSPGARNSVASVHVPPVVESVEWQPKGLRAGEALSVSVKLANADQIESAHVHYRIVAPGTVGKEEAIALRRQGDVFVAMLPPSSRSNRLLRFRISAKGRSGGTIFYPHPHELRPAFSVYVRGDLRPDKIPLVQLFFVGGREFARGERYRESQSGGGYRGGYGHRGFGGPGRYGDSSATPLPPQGPAAVIYMDPKQRTPQVFDFVNVVERKSGWKARFHKDLLLDGMNTVNFLYEPVERTVVNESLSYKLYELAGNKACKHGFARLAINGEPVGYHLYFEQPNGNFLRRNKIEDTGDLYKLIWMGTAEMSSRVPYADQRIRPDITGRYEKKSNRHEGHQDLIRVIEAFENATSDEHVWQLITKHIEINQVVNYFAVNSLISHWDGFFNNYFAYFDRQGTGKWSLYPWDQDSTWSQRGGSSDSLYRMPLYFGAEGATPNGLLRVPWEERNRGRFGGRRFGRRFGAGGLGWWRDGGDFSRPLLANPIFYLRFRKRLDELTRTVFTEKTFGPQIDQLMVLEPEVRLRARLRRQNEDAAARQLRQLILDLRKHLVRRRAFVRSELRRGGIE